MMYDGYEVSTHSRLKAAGSPQNLMYDGYEVSTHSRLKAAGFVSLINPPHKKVSTHSRLKAAGPRRLPATSHRCRFNTQPPEGGWLVALAVALATAVSTHSRLKAAGDYLRS